MGKTATLTWREGSSLSSFPSQTVDDAVKLTDEWKNACMDFMEYQAMTFDTAKRKEYKKYQLLGPDYPFSDFGYISNPFEYIKEDQDEYGNTEEIKHFPIAAQSINTFIGEYLKRPLNFYVVSTSPRARNEQLRLKSDMLFQTVQQQIQQRIIQELQAEGLTPESPDFAQQMQARSPEQIQDYFNKDYSDVVEQVGQKICKNLWLSENLDMEFMYGMRHACITAKEFYHIYNIRNQVKIRCKSPLNVFYHKSEQNHWISQSQYAGFHEYMTLSTIVDTYNNKLSVDDVRALENLTNPGAAGHTSAYNSNIYASHTGVTFATMNEDNLDRMLSDFQHTGSSFYFNNAGMIRVVQAYWRSKKEVAEVLFVDESGEPKTMYIDRNYKIDYEAVKDVRWEYLDQIYQGTKIGTDIYLDIKPYEHQYYDPDYPTYCPLPIEGCLYNNMHTEPISLVDLMTPWIELYDIVAHELKKDMRKSIGKVMFMSYDNLPKIKGFTKEKWLYWLREFGIAWVSNDSKNQGNFSHYSAQDMSFAEQMVMKMQILDKIKANCDAFAGFSQPRLGDQTSVDSGKQANQSMVASVNQTEYWYFKHSKLIQMVLSQAVNLQKRLIRNTGFLRNLFDDMELAYLDFENLDLDNEMLQVFVTNSSQALEQKELLKQMVTPAMQNGADLLDMSDIILAETQSEVRNVLEKLRRQRQQNEQAAREAEEQKLQTLQQIEMDKLEREEAMLDKKLASQERQSYIRTFAMQPDNLVDNNDNKIPDSLEYMDYFTKMTKVNTDTISTLSKVKNDRDKLRMEGDVKKKELELKNKELDLQEKNMQNDLLVARENRKGRNK